ncbi:MAG: MFS transporter [Planctomycetaceae bacterium]
MNREPIETQPVVYSDSTRMLRLRFLVLGLLCLAPISAYLTRVISGINTTLQAEFQFDDKTVGHIFAAFNVGYLLFQVPGGWLAQRFSVRRVFPLLAASWSLATIWFSLSRTEESLWASRMVMGLSQAGMVPCCALVISAWVKDSYRGLYSSLINIAMQTGGVIATSLTGNLLLGNFTDPPVPMTWSEIYFCYAFTGIGFAVLFYWVYRDHPQSHPWLGYEAESTRVNNPVPNGSQDSTPGYSAMHIVGIMLVSSAMWLICLQGFFRAFAYEFFTTYFTAYLENARGMKLDVAGNWASLPIIGFGTGGIVGGLTLDLIYHQTGNKWISRSLTAAISMALCALCTGLAAFVTDSHSAILLISLGAFLASFAGPCTWAACLDISGKRSAVIFGIMNSVGAFGAWLCPVVVGSLFKYIKETGGDWNYVLYLFVFVNLAGALSWIALNPSRRVVDDGEEGSV